MERNATGWPVHPDGRPIRMGELPIEEQRAQLRFACERLKKEFQHPEAQAALAAHLAIEQARK